MLKVGLTGGIGSGKSAVASYFTKLKVPVIDADLIAHQLLKPGTSCYRQVCRHFGESILNANKNIDRKKLKEIIFTHKKERIWLEDLLHPAIRKKMEQNLKKIKAPYCVLVIPLLFETKYPMKLDRVLVVDCSSKNQIERLRKRDNCSIKQIKQIIGAQIKRTPRLKRADEIIYNNQTLADLKKTVRFLHRYYLGLGKKNQKMPVQKSLFVL